MKVSVSSRQRKTGGSSRAIKRDSLRALSSLGLKRAELSVLLAGPRLTRELNLRYRGVDGATDVLSFPLFSSGEEFPPDSDFMLGDIVINVAMAREQAERYGVSLEDELRRLLVHGILHLLGYDHERGAAEARRMKAIERRLLNKIARP